MNAYELANELEKLYQQDCIDGVADISMPESANMLRQQADRISGLENQRESLTSLLELQIKMHETAVAMIKPASVIRSQTKPLSDEEILDLWCDFENDDTPVRSFARAIEERIFGK